MNKFEEIVKAKLQSTVNNNNASYNEKNLKNLKIIIENTKDSTTQSDDDDNNDEILEHGEQMDGIELVTNDQVEDDDETEFHVNLDKAPPTLQNTILNEKIYLNESATVETNLNLDHIDQKDLDQLYESLNLNESNFISSEITLNSDSLIIDPKTQKNFYRKEALHLYGVDNLSTNEIFDFFKQFKPLAIEWINDSSCNLVWKNEIHAANALLHMSVPYEQSDSTLQRLPPQGCKWRKANQLIKDKFLIYMRYVKKTDRKIKGAESRSKYYVRNGNPNYGNLKGLISDSKRKEMKIKQLNDAEADLTFDDEENGSERQLVSYNLDEQLSREVTEEFGVSQSANIKIKTRMNNSNNYKRKNMMSGLYADRLDNENDNDDEDGDNDQQKFNYKKRTRYQPYTTSHLRQDTSKPYQPKDSNDLRNKLNQLNKNSLKHKYH